MSPFKSRRIRIALSSSAPQEEPECRSKGPLRRTRTSGIRSRTGHGPEGR